MNVRKFCPVGKVMSGVHIVIFNEEKQVQPVGASGEVRLFLYQVQGPW